MKKQKTYVTGFLLLLLIWTNGCKPTKEVHAPLSLTWEMGAPSESPLSSNVVVIEGSDDIWLYDVGNHPDVIDGF